MKIKRIGMFGNGMMVVFNDRDEQWSYLQKYVREMSKEYAQSYLDVIESLVTEDTEYFSGGTIGGLCDAVMAMADTLEDKEHGKL